MDSYLRETTDPEDLVECSACHYDVSEVYFVTEDDRTDLSYPGDALCESCSYALRFKRFLAATQPDD
eukprot:13936011-Alexandrium_andersonii.AAC.1